MLGAGLLLRALPAAAATAAPAPAASAGALALRLSWLLLLRALRLFAALAALLRRLRTPGTLVAAALRPLIAIARLPLIPVARRALLPAAARPLLAPPSAPVLARRTAHARPLLELLDLALHVLPLLCIVAQADLVVAAVGTALPPLRVGLLARRTGDAFRQGHGGAARIVHFGP